MPNSANHFLPLCQPVTQEPGDHFFGYYDKDQFSPDDRFLLALECNFIGRLQKPTDRAVIGLVDLHQDKAWIPVAETLAWNWQMGAMAEWLPGKERRIIYNDRRDNAFVAVILNLESRRETVLPGPVWEVAPDGRSALTLNFARLWDLRPETGYCGLTDPWHDDAAPSEDGIFQIDLQTGQHTPLITHETMTRLPDFQAKNLDQDSKWYFTHLLYNEDGSRFMFWYRCQSDSGNFSHNSGVYTASALGDDIHLVTNRNSHCTWLGKDGILAWSKVEDDTFHTYLFTDRTSRYEPWGNGQLEFNGHATFSPDRQWLLTDKEPNESGQRTLILYHVEQQRRYDIARLPSLPELGNGMLRCDLHPRWNRSGNMVCFDSTHSGQRQMYIFPLSAIS